MPQAPQTLDEALKAGGKIVAPQTLDEALKQGGRVNGATEQTQASSKIIDPRLKRTMSLMGMDPAGQGNMVRGVVKSVGQTLLGGVSQIPALREAYGGSPEPAWAKAFREKLQPAPSEQTGATIGRMAQYAIPGLISGGASIPIQAAAGALGAAGISSGAGESPGIPAAIGAAGPLVGALGGKLIPSLRKGAQERVAAAIGPRGLQEQKELARVLPEITKRQPFAWSSEGLKDQFEKQANTVADKLDKVIEELDATGRLQSTNAIAHTLDGQVKAILSGGGIVTPEGRAMMAQLKQVQSEIKELGRIHAPRSILGTESEIGLPRIVDKKTVGATVAKLRELKQQYGAIIEGTGKHFYRDVAESSRAAMAKEGYHATQKGMISAVPEAKELGQEYSRLATVRDLLRKQELRNIAGSRRGVGTIAETGGVAGAIVTGRPQLAETATVMKGLLKFTDSTPFKLASANVRTSFANAIESGNAQLAAQLMAQMIAEQQADLIRKK